jgi:rhodanese-related sulfurtransferase
MGFGWLFASQVEQALAWMSRNGGLAAAGLGCAFALYIAYKAWQRWRLARFVHAARISVDELHERLAGDPKPFLVDIGSKLAQQARPRIPGATLMDLDDVARDAASFPIDRDIVFYCQCPNEASAKRAAQILLAKGYRQVRPLVGGLDAWIASGRAVEHGIPATFVRR